MKKIVAGAACLLLAGVTAVSLTACGIFSASVPDGNYPSGVASASGDYGSAESWLAAQEVPSTYERRLYEEALADGSFNGTYYEYLASLGLSSEDDTAAINRAMCSVVAIEATFTNGQTRTVSDGSGVIYRLDKAAGEAYIVTNYHVIAEATTGLLGPSSTTRWSAISVGLYGGETIEAGTNGTVQFVVGNNATSDIAVLYVESDLLRTSSASAAAYAQAEVGEEAYAIGNAEGAGISVTRGVISVLSEQIAVTAADEVTPVTFYAMRTDAAINQGNSGGGLFNERGELLGIVTARRESVGSTAVDGFGYAISAEDVNAQLASWNAGTIAPAQASEEGEGRVLLDSEAARARAANSVVTVVGEDGEGSGVIYDLDKGEGDAYIITNYHVIYAEGRATGVSEQIAVYLYGDSEEKNAVPAQYVGGAMAEDVAVLRVEDSATLAASDACEAIAADSSSLTVGEDVYVAGNAGGLGLSMTKGVLSVAGETIYVAAADDSKTLTLFAMRTDADVNHGNSGGGMFNEMGELVGIVSARSEDEGVVAFGYALPADRALLIAQNIIDNAAYSQGAVRASLGGVTLYAAGSHALFYEGTGKLYLEERVAVRAIEGGVAAKMGLDVGDTLLEVRVERGERTVYSAAVTRAGRADDFTYAVRLGDTLRLTISRGGEIEELSYTFSSVQDFTEVL